MHKLHISGHYKVEGSASEGVGQVILPVWTAIGSTDGVFKIESFLSVRRRYGEKDTGTVTKIKVKGVKDVVYKLAISKESGEGEAAFDASGKKEKDYTGTGEFTEVELFGLLESTTEHNLKITGSKDGNILDEAKFIVFSQIEIKWNSEETQHKDTAAPCVECDKQWDVLPAGKEFQIHAHNEDDNPDTKSIPCDHGTWLGECFHCGEYCLRCCMKQIKGGKQDDYRIYINGIKTTVEENHMKLFPSEQATNNYGFSQKDFPKYEFAYQLILGNKKLIDTKLHSLVVFGARNNCKDGSITGQQELKWDPTPAASRTGWKHFESETYLY